METHSIHLLIELWDADPSKLNSVTAAREILIEAARQARVTVLHSAFHRFSPVGVSGVVMIAESHITIHTWPESAYAAVDVFTCGDCAMPELAADYLAEALEAQHVEVTRIRRGIRKTRNSRPVPHPAVTTVLA